VYNTSLSNIDLRLDLDKERWDIGAHCLVESLVEKEDFTTFGSAKKSCIHAISVWIGHD